MVKIKPFTWVGIWILFLLLPGFGYAGWVVENNYRFKINIPENWQKAEYAEGKDYVFDFMSPDKRLAVQIRVSDPDDNYIDASRLITPFEKALSHEGVQKLSMDECIHNGTSGKLGVYTTSFGDDGAGIATFYAVKNGFGYIVLFIIPNNLFDSRRNEMDQIMKSFEILSPDLPVAIQEPEPEKPDFLIQDVFLDTEGNQSLEQAGGYYVFSNETPRIFAWFSYDNAPPEAPVIIRWVSTDDNREMNRTVIQSFSTTQGRSSSSLFRPNQGWDPGDYKVEIVYQNEIVQTAVFQIQAPVKKEIQPLPEQPIVKEEPVVQTDMPPPPASETEHYIRQIKLGPLESFDFQSGSISTHTDDDIVLETTCNYKLPAIRGNWALTGKSDFQEVSSPPAEGYTFVKFPERKSSLMPLKEVVVFYLEDGTYGKFMITKHAFLEAVSEPRCRHYIEALVEYPVFD